MTSKKLLGGLLAMLLVAAIAVPSAAVALPRFSALKGVRTATETAGGALASAHQRVVAMLEQRVASVLQRRKLRFDSAAGRIGTRITRVGQIADKVAASGGDVSAARASLAEAQSELDQANDIEQQCVSAFRAVPDEADKFQAFRAARQLGVRARTHLVQSRSDLQAAIAGLRGTIQQLKGASTSSASDAVADES